MSTASSHSWHTNMRDTASDSDSESELKTVVGTSDPGVKNLSKEKGQEVGGLQMVVFFARIRSLSIESWIFCSL